MEETGCEIICGAQTTLAVKGQMMTMMIHGTPLRLVTDIEQFSVSSPMAPTLPTLCGGLGYNTEV